VTSGSEVGFLLTVEPRAVVWFSLVRISLRKRTSGVTLTELLCVLAIIAILCALYLPTIARAYQRIRHFLAGL